MRNASILTMVFVAVASISASATIINIPDDYETIQEGIDASFDGDTVRVASGTYVENIDFSGKNIVVRSWFLDDGDTSFISSTIIDGGASGSVVRFVNGEDNNAIITGFTIQNGTAWQGGGIECFYSSPTIINNTISGNSAEWGGGIHCFSCSPTINYNTISGNSAGAYGGGIYCRGNSNPTINYNTISGNSAYQGGGIRCAYNSSPVITNTIFWGDSAPNGPEIYLDDTSSPVITYCDVQGGWEGNGNIDCDPMFCDPESGNFYLADASCCVGAGEGGVDIGAFGIGCHLPYIINIPADYETIQEGIDASFDGDTVRVASGTYVENIDFSGKNIVLGSWFLDDGDPSYISSTIIDGGAAGSVVTFGNGEDNSAIITGFTIRNGLALSGGAIRCWYSSPTISNNTISGNTSETGGGIYCVYSYPTISNNTISGNSAYYYGGGIHCNNSNPTISNNTISGNSADSRGGGIYCLLSLPTITNNTISENSAEYNGGGIYCFDSSPVITNTIFWSDSAPNGPEIYLSGASSPVITYCDVQGGWEGEGNIDCDPEFCDPENGNFYLHANSCCVGAGEGGVDIGAFGVGCGIINIPADYETIQEGIDASSHGDIVRVASGTYVENIDFSGKNIVVGSWFLDDGDTSFISSTIIDGNQSGSVVSFGNGEDNSAVITGFTIQNGIAERGGGIYCNSSNPTISNNTITGNSASDYGGGIYCGENSNPTISNNIISGNSTNYFGGGILCLDNSNPTISNNTISGNSANYGGGIYCGRNSSPTISNNTISGNSAGNEGGGICCGNSSPVITNTIFWADSAPDGPEIFLDGTSSPVITYCDVQGGWPGEGNIADDPWFCDPAADNYWLAENSPCVGAGQNGEDIGAFGIGCDEHVNIYTDNHDMPDEFLLSINYPNPFNASTTINYTLAYSTEVILDIYDILGRKVETLISREQPAGYHKITWNADKFSSGVYFYKLQAGDYIETKKMALLK